MKKSQYSECRANARLALHRGRGALLGALILYMLISWLVISPLLQLTTGLAVRTAAGGRLLNNMAGLVTNPLMLLAVIVVIAVSLAWTFFNVAVMITGLHLSRVGEPLTLRSIYSGAFKSTLRALQPRNWMILILSGLILPFLMPVSAASFIEQVDLPEFISEVIYKTPAMLAAFILLLIALAVLAVLWTFVFHRFVLKGETFAQAARGSIELIRRCWLRSLWEQIWARLKVVVPCFVLLIAAGAALLGLALIVRSDLFAVAVSIVWGYVIWPLCAIVIDVLGELERYSVLENMMYAVSGDEPPVSAKPARRGGLLRILAHVYYTLVGVFCVGLVVAMMVNPKIASDILVPTETTITAHRGYMLTGPENTLPAFTDAIDSGLVDYGELDVQLTKDGAVVINHDPTLARTTGVNKAVYELTLDEIKQLTVTTKALSTGEPVSAPIPTLDEVIKACKGKLKLNIEIKTFPETPTLEAEVVRIIEDNDFVDECVITGQNFDSIHRIKELNPNLRCGYVLTMALGDYIGTPDCDLFSVECSYVTPEMVAEAHKLGKEVHCWTVCSREVAMEMADCGVDSIITNDPVAVSAALADSYGTPLWIYDLYRRVRGEPAVEELLNEA